MSDEDGKLFVGGLSWETTAEKMENYFSKFGEVVESKVMKDKVTENSRGFGFVKFKTGDAVTAVLNARPHILDNKTIDPKPCTSKEDQMKKKEAERLHVTTHKIFIGGLTQNMTEEEIKAFFTKFGTVTDVSFAINKEDNKNKGFGFVTFTDEDAVNQALKVHYHEINQKTVEAKRAQPREKMRQMNQQQGGQQGTNQMNQNYNYQGNWGNMGNMGWGPGYDMQGNMMGAGGCMPSSGYGGYGSYYGNYGAQYGYGYPQNMGMGSTAGYGNMGTYNNQSASMYGPQKSQTYGNGKEATPTDAKTGGYHPYGR